MTAPPELPLSVLAMDLVLMTDRLHQLSLQYLGRVQGAQHTVDVRDSLDRLTNDASYPPARELPPAPPR
jgi:hypothetical protein